MTCDICKDCKNYFFCVGVDETKKDECEYRKDYRKVYNREIEMCLVTMKDPHTNGYGKIVSCSHFTEK